MNDSEVGKLIDDLTELAKSWRLRGFNSTQMVCAMTGAALTVLSGAGLTRDQVVQLVDSHFGETPHARPSVQA